ncbi:hypothetical protein J1782_07095 [Rahnella sp. BCC 1045]|uniref:hypothetical protein n=1 Tax=Rahnella sp. BCC 1045 TaxID=2816251 RepID=UPI001C27B438|nr:hypothetical protein [Rahnella sp. BCC 1045]MBU9819651.1 hypothetical protein [Rahnella sp. BCC 1045]
MKMNNISLVYDAVVSASAGDITLAFGLAIIAFLLLIEVLRGGVLLLLVLCTGISDAFLWLAGHHSQTRVVTGNSNADA